MSRLSKNEFELMMAKAADKITELQILNAALVAVLEQVNRSFEDVALGRGGWAWEEILDDVQMALQKAKEAQSEAIR